MITDEQIKEYSDMIDYDLGLDELLLLLAELTNDKHIIEVANKYVDLYNEWFVKSSNNYEALQDIKKTIADLVID